jgi:hypothetical protein
MFFLECLLGIGEFFGILSIFHFITGPLLLLFAKLHNLCLDQNLDIPFNCFSEAEMVMSGLFMTTTVMMTWTCMGFLEAIEEET